MKKTSWLFLFVFVLFGVNNVSLAQKKQPKLLVHLEIRDKKPIWSPDGKKIAFLSNRDQVKVDSGYSHLYELYTIDTDGNNIKKISGLSDTLHSVECFCWSPNSKRIAYSASKSENTKERKWIGNGIFIINSDGTNLRNFIDDEFADEIYWAPDGANLAFTSHGSINIANSTRKYTLTDGTNPVWSPDSKQIAFKTRGPRVGGADFYTINIENKNKKEHELVNYFASAKSRPNQGEKNMSVGEANRVYWSPDGSKIYAQTNRSIVVKKINGFNEHWRIVIESPDEDPDPNWESYDKGTILDSALSPDGKEIVFLLYNDIYKVSSIPGAVVRMGYRIQSKLVNLRGLTKTPQIAEEKPLWSPDGKQIVFTRDGELWMMNSDGSNQAQLTNEQMAEK